MLNLLSKALTAVVLDGDAREAVEDAGGFVSAIQGSADMRTVIQQLKAEQPRQTQHIQIGGYTPLTSPATTLAATLSNPAVMTNSAALQAALLAEILASARATAAGTERPVASQLTAPVAPRVPAPAPAKQPVQHQPFNPPPPTSPLGGSAGTLHTAIMAQALASARAAVSGGTVPHPVMQTPPMPQRMPASAPAAPPSRPPRGKRLPAAERAQLIQNALKVHSAKQAVLSNLTDEQRVKLAELAAKLLDPKSSAGEA